MRETLRNWTEDAETFVLEVIFEQRKGKRAALLRTTLLALSKIFTLAMKICCLRTQRPRAPLNTDH